MIDNVAVRSGIRRNWKTIPRSVLAAWGVAWLIIESFSYFSSGFKEFSDKHSFIIAVGTAVLGFFYAFSRLIEPKSVSFLLKTTNTRITIRFGDIFSCTGHTAIAVNEYFDSQLGAPVALSSVHGQFINRAFGGDSPRLDLEVDRALGGQDYIEIQRTIGRCRRYPIGTTATIQTGSKKYFLFALTRTDPVTCKASADLPQMWEALKCLWTTARYEANHTTVHIPLVGAGASGVGLGATHLLRLMILSILIETRTAPITNEVEIVLHPSLLDEINLRSVSDDWR